ncbi:MAG TPA: ParB/RepB/Spo0J family partition protein [Candidatus Paceibacterota bacterium]|nr:ParB/RepB/Spo0J family partition protein [Candidatus Paceibacterota bacterium]
MGQSARKLEPREAEQLGQPLPIRRSKIIPYEGQPRRYFDPKGIEELAHSIRTEGQQEPVKLCKHSRQSDVFVLIGGERRWRAFGLIGEQTGTDPIMLAWVDMVNDEAHHFKKALLHNLQREDLVPLDEAAAYQRLFNDIKEPISFSAKVDQIAATARKSSSHVKNYLKLNALPFQVKQLMDPARPASEKLTVTAAIDIAKSTKDPKLQITIAKEAIDRALGIDELRMLISVRTGASGYGIGGSLRSARDDYRTLKGFLTNTNNRLLRVERGLDIEAIYASREDEDDDRTEDAKVIKAIIRKFEAMLKKVEEPDV